VGGRLGAEPPFFKLWGLSPPSTLENREFTKNTIKQIFTRLYILFVMNTIQLHK
jgi:hypothetical protein